jgi:ubiquitin carboxyl-terminal hydrolase 14
MESTI